MNLTDNDSTHFKIYKFPDGQQQVVITPEGLRDYN